MSGGVCKVSVIIPSYNHGCYIGEALSSVLGQVGSNYDLEVIVIDDGSTDNSVDILKALNGSSVVPFELVLKSNEGLCKTLNRAINNYATGEYIAIIASDDLWCADKITKQIEHLENNPESELCYSNAKVFGVDVREKKASKYLFSGRVKNILTLYNFIPAGTIIFSKGLYDTVGGFDQNGLLLEDWDFLLRASSKTKFCYLDDELLLYRQHGESAIAKMRKGGYLYSEKMKVLKKNSSLLNPCLKFFSKCLHFILDVLLRPVMSKLKS